MPPTQSHFLPSQLPKTGFTSDLGCASSHLSTLRNLSPQSSIRLIPWPIVPARCSSLSRGLPPQSSRVLPATRIGKFAPSPLYNVRFQSSRAPCSAPNGITGQVCNWVDSIQLSDIPSDVRTKVKFLILDGIACAIVGAKLPWSKVAVQAVLDIEGPGKCTVFGWNKRTSPLNAALLNGSLIQGFELDDVHVDAPWHANSIVLPALFAAAEYAQRSDAVTKIEGARFLTSTIAGFELGSRIGRALHAHEMLSRGWHSGAVFGPPAAAAAVSKLLHLSPGQIEDTLSTACTQAYGLMSTQYESMAKRMQHGFTARNGLFAALTSRHNYTGIDQVFERPYGGFLATFGQGSKHDSPYIESELVDCLGRDWRGIEGIRLKQHNSMVATHAPVDCIAALQAKYPEKFADVESISKIVIEQSKAPHAHGGQHIERPITTTGAQMSTRYITAVQLLDRKVLLKQFTDANLERDDTWDLIRKIDCVWNEDFDEKSAWYTRVSVAFADGEELVHEMPLSNATESLISGDKIKEKWRMITDGIIDGRRRDELEDAVMSLETLGDVTEISGMLAGELRGALD